MQSIEIVRLMLSDSVIRPIFKGVFPIDKIPDITSYPSAMIVNMDGHDEPGSHWVALYFDKKRRCDFFNSYGVEPKDILKAYIEKNSVSYSYNEKQVQKIFTTTCGQFCIFFLFWRVRGVSMKTIMSCLEKRTADEIITGFVNKLYKINTKVFDDTFFNNYK
jgi:hypothetical protein